MSPSPDLQSKFMEFMLAHNRARMQGFQEWLFQPGMRFNSPQKWWGDQGPRYVPHEGLDLYSFVDANGTLHTLDQNISIPAAFAGDIIKIEPDFLGKSIYLSHEIFSTDGRQLISVYGHTIPRQLLKSGQKVAAGEIIGRISGFSDKKTTLVPHLHITFAWVPVHVALNQLDWKNLDNDPGITLIDPLSVISSLI